MQTIGIHLQQTLTLIDTPRPSAIARIDSSATLTDLRFVGDDDDLIAQLVDAPSLILVDAPLAVPNSTGSRDVERVLQWCDVPVFPVSGKRLDQVMGGHRAAALASRWPRASRVAETVPDLPLRLATFAAQTGGAQLELSDYRARWLGVRSPRYRPKGAGRANATGIAAATRVLSGLVDLAGWEPHPEPDDWQAIRDAAAIDAISCAWVAFQAVHDPPTVMCVGDDLRGEMALPTDANLAQRLLLTVDRLAAEGTIAITARAPFLGPAGPG